MPMLTDVFFTFIQEYQGAILLPEREKQIRIVVMVIYINQRGYTMTRKVR